MVILIPIYDDWASFAELVGWIDAELVRLGKKASLLVVDDASVHALAPAVLRDRRFQGIIEIRVLRLRTNVGHQRAIVSGLVHLSKQGARPDGVLVMDGDGEDRPEDIGALLERAEACGGKAVIFAERKQRTEDWRFKACYRIYKVIFRLLSGVGISFGNFCFIPPGLLGSLASVPDIWNHFAAGVLKSRVPIERIPLARGRRIHGLPRMNFENLVLHGLSAISVFSEAIGVRAIFISVLAMAGAALATAAVAALRLFGGVALPPWSPVLLGVLLLGLFQLLILVTIFAFMVLHNRNASRFYPQDDCRRYVDRDAVVWPGG